MASSFGATSDRLLANLTVQPADDAAYDSALVTVFQKVLPVFLILAGTVGNILTIMALRRNETLKSAFRVYHSALACFDLLVLYVCLVRFWFLALVHFDLRHGHVFICKGQAWLEHSFLMVPSWILVAMTMQTYDGLSKPHTLGTNLTRTKAVLYSLSATFIALLYNVHILLLFGDMSSKEESFVLTPSSSHNHTGGLKTNHTSTAEDWSRSSLCMPTSDAYAKFVTYVWPWVDTVAVFVGPMIVIFVGFALIVRLLVSMSKRVPQTDTHGAMQLTSSILILDVMFVVMSAPFCIFNLANPLVYEVSGATQSAKQIYVSSVVHGVFYALFAFRWIVTCSSGRLWSFVLAMLKSAKRCRKK